MCPLCAKVCQGKQGFVDHMRGIHGIGKPVFCVVCGQTFKWRSSLALHRKKCSPAFVNARVPEEKEREEDLKKS